jgi:hypothetical protein
MKDEIMLNYLKLDFCKFLPSPFGRGAGGEGMAYSHKLGRSFFAQKPSPSGRED